MIRIGHLLDDDAGWEQRISIGQLFDRLPRERYTSILTTIAPAATEALRTLKKPIQTLTPVPGFSALSGALVSRYALREKLDLISAWGVRAAAAACAVDSAAIIVHIFDPIAAAEDVKLLRTIARPNRFAVSCANEIVRRRLIEGGLDAELLVTIRPGVDLNLINRYRRGNWRHTMGFEQDDFIVTVPAPITRHGGQFEACRALANLHQIIPKLRLVVHGDSPEVRRISRLAKSMPRADGRTVPDSQCPFEQIIANANALLITPGGDISTTSIAWAMGAGAVVIGTAVHAVAEMISHKVNGLLFKHTPQRSMMADLARCLRDQDTHKKAIDAARGQAYEVFGVRRYIEQNIQLAENLLAGRRPSDGISDSSIAV